MKKKLKDAKKTIAELIKTWSFFRKIFVEETEIVQLKLLRNKLERKKWYMGIERISNEKLTDREWKDFFLLKEEIAEKEVAIEKYRNINKDLEDKIKSTSFRIQKLENDIHNLNNKLEKSTLKDKINEKIELQKKLMKKI